MEEVTEVEDEETEVVGEEAIGAVVAEVVVDTMTLQRKEEMVQNLVLLEIRQIP